MASCTKCGATLVAQARFCAACGSPVPRDSLAQPVAAAQPPTEAAPDPFAKTVMGDELVRAVEAAPRAAVSPMASSVMSSNDKGPTASPPANPTTAPLAQAAPGARPGAARFAPPVPQQTTSFAPGAPVLVYWADGARYPGTVLQVSAQHLFIAFPNGMQQWVDVRFVTAGS